MDPVSFLSYLLEFVFYLFYSVNYRNILDIYVQLEFLLT